jgi:hypothetical protein
MNNKEKFWYLIGPVVVSLVYAATSPMIHYYFITQVSPQVIATANLLQIGLAAGVNYSIQVDKFKEWYRKNFLLIIIMDVILLTTSSFAGVNYPELRFMGLAVINSVSTVLWVMIMKNIANKIIVDGDARTDFEALNESACLTASFIGGVSAVVLMPKVEICLALQCLANAFMGATDYYSFQVLNKKILD